MADKRLSAELQTALDAAREGAKVALNYFKKNVEFSVKDDSSIVTKADHESEAIIKAHIKKRFSHASFFAEESGGDRNKDEFWIIDPVDGTRSFSRGIPTWCILIALYRNGRIVLGVCYFPVLNELLYAERGFGAFHNSEHTKVSDVKHFKDAYAGYGSPKRFRDKQVIIDYIEKSASARSPDATYSAFLVATGQVGSLIDAYGMIWDTAPFKVIIEEAGGRVTALNGEDWSVHGQGYIVTNGLLHDEVLSIVNKKS